MRARRIRSPATRMESARLAIRHEEKELLAAVPVGALPRPHHQIDAGRDAPQRLVAGEVAVVVVVAA